MASIKLSPLSETQFGLFYKSQFKTKLIPPPPSTNLVGQTAIITGSNSGIGAEAARVFLSCHLSHIILAVRSVGKGEKVAAPLRKKYTEAKIEVWQLDMLSYKSIQAFAKRCSTLSRLDMVILNAGVGAADFKTDPATGHEETIQVNYLSTTLLAILLLPTLKALSPTNTPGRLMIVTSALGLWAKFPNRNADPLLPSFDDPTGWNMAAAMERYSVSKTLVMMLIKKLGDLIDPNDVVVNGVEPGFTAGSNLQRNAPLLARAGGWVFKAITARSTTQAAWTYIDAVVVKGKESHGGFLMNWEIYPFHAMMYEPEGLGTIEKLWEESLKELESAGVRGVIDSIQRKV
ncbi:Fc.00g104840.m01.CDS01 [Cosmosporella sp. VM-42]